MLGVLQFIKKKKKDHRGKLHLKSYIAKNIILCSILIISFSFLCFFAAER